MKIAYVMESIAICGGLERIMVEKMNYLAEHDICDVLLVEVYDYPGDDAFALSRKVRRVKLNIKKHALTIIKPMTFWQAANKVNDVIQQEKPDVMTSAGLLGEILYGLRRYPCHMIFESHQVRSTMPLPWLMRRMEQNVDMVVCLTQGDASEFTLAKEACVIPNFIVPAVSAEDIKDNDNRNIVALGRLVKMKGFDLLIEAWHTICHKLTDHKLLIYGDGPEYDALQRLIDKKKHRTLHNSSSYYR